ncbi:glycosyl transferase, WecB/TagA/CpsF family [Thermodesulfobium narugense DSM 14796]|uniref:Glycosyl transferase, WecB/TagA/CpsF family n=2 Tax=Thermodesulfobium narugense TaxID=184064 RepID=M1E4B3_9BACT|nr:glycosyl transferase, WecB/TagA/CpsF family [Thermodesulfobium narugense DSM 14796]
MRKFLFDKVPVDIISLEEILNLFEERLVKNLGLRIITLNPEMVMYSMKKNNSSTIMLETFNRADLVVPDGIGIAIFLNTKRICGVDLIPHFLEICKKHDKGIYLIGSTDEVVKSLSEKLLKMGIKVVGYENGYFTDFKPSIERIILSGATFVMSAMGFPKQEIFLNELFKAKSDIIGIGVGGSFDVLSGKKKRAPEIFRNLGLEWLYRLLSEPTRLKRMLVLPEFALLAFFWRIKNFGE